MGWNLHPFALLRGENGSQQGVPGAADRRCPLSTQVKGPGMDRHRQHAVLRIETDLVSSIPQIDLQMEHLVIVYAPIDFQKSHVRLWLPASASLYLSYRGHRYERVHNFSQFQLFSVDAARVIKEPITSRDENPQ
jgi:hypothetical protein